MNIFSSRFVAVVLAPKEGPDFLFQIPFHLPPSPPHYYVFRVNADGSGHAREKTSVTDWSSLRNV